MKTDTVLCGTKSSWRPVTSGVCQQSILFSIFLNHLGDGAECTLSKFAEDIRLRGVAHAPEGCAAYQRDLNRLEKWPDRNLRQFNYRKCQVLHLGRNNPMHQYMLGADRFESSFAEKGMGALVGAKLHTSHQCACVAEKDNCLLSCIRRSVASRSRKVILPLWSALINTCLEYWIQFWAP